MARPTKQGVDYFPLDVYLDDKFKFIEIKYNLEGFAIVIKLMQRIYSQGYWCRWTEDELLLFADEIKADHQLVQSVVNECLNRGIFNKELHDNYNILTSSGIQKRYQEIVRRRKVVDVTEEYLLIDGDLGVNDDINPSSRQHNDSKSTQSKGKESKQKESSSRKYIYDDTHLSMAESFYKKILDNNPNNKKPDFEKWANEIRLMMERDGRNEEQITYLMNWVQQDDFEMSNVMSPDKLRKRFDQLIMKVKNQKSKTPSKEDFDLS
ncbi:hypothetical protein GCM10007063_05860 [Lentibacillus kapialis]|uniref:Lin1244/Lin1753-like N-terminal domain-containing protein n=1 Tax=Lentibacillus kapialis TaxID=340214 RepID=A0A917PNN8_9BACI|nr:DUF4373 domain-containing protein [Lentibacillus kapialis]GGJ86174.1 hypothetical protein GCM10007063_05860 [Lentibacillus kapialis]